jgi:hypothetical protein
MTASFKSRSDNLEGIIAELQAIKEFPVMLQVYDRVFRVDTEEELLLFKYGIEVGNYLAKDKKEGRI